LTREHESRTPAVARKIYCNNIYGQECKQILHEGIWSINFLEKMTHPDIYAVHQCARLSSELKASHNIVIRFIGRYLMSTEQERLIQANEMMILAEIGDHKLPTWIN